MEDPETQELRIEQIEREAAQREHARDTDLPTEEHAAVRRADKHAYLREKLEERARSEQDG